jgi:toxin YhaV
MTSFLNCNGWSVYYHPLFAEDYKKLELRVIKLRKKLPDSEFRVHSTVKLYAALVRAIEEKIPIDPFSSSFCLKGTLKSYCRVKGMGIPDRYRLFFRVFREDKSIIILWLGYPRRQGHKKDCYALFSKMVSRGQFPETVKELLEKSLEKP